MLPVGKIFAGLLVVIVYYLLTFHVMTEYLLNPTSSDTHLPTIDIGHHPRDLLGLHELRWVPYNDYAAIPYFYIKQGIVESTNLITICAGCDIDLLYEAEHITQNYKTGPLSFAIYINSDYTKIDLNKTYYLIINTFANVSSLYDITIAILAYNTSNEFYQHLCEIRDFDENSPLTFTIPTNVLRNLAEYQVKSDWIFNIDIDFWYLSDTLNSEKNVKLLIEGMESMISSKNYGGKTVFVVPAFEIIMDSAERFEYSSLTKRQLTDLVYLEEIEPFHEKMMAQRCTRYEIWYESERPYILNFQQVFCHWTYEPWFIIHRDVSRMVEHQWDNTYIGRGLNKVERVFMLRHLCFNFIIMHNLFMIHAPQNMVRHHEDVTEEQKKKWHEFNLLLFNMTSIEMKKDPNSCLGNTDWSDLKNGQELKAKALGNGRKTRKQIFDEASAETKKKLIAKWRAKQQQQWERNQQKDWDKHDNGHTDKYCDHGVISPTKHKEHCYVCCERKCGSLCGGEGCGKIDHFCCLGNIYHTKRKCDKSTAPCELTIDDQCPHVSHGTVSFINDPT